MKFINTEALTEFVKGLTEEEKTEQMQLVMGKLVMQQMAMQNGKADDILEFAETIALMGELAREE